MMRNQVATDQAARECFPQARIPASSQVRKLAVTGTKREYPQYAKTIHLNFWVFYLF
jgi:hypothetical protein